MDEKEQHQQMFDQPFGQGQLQGKIMRQRLCIHRHVLIQRLGIIPFS